MEISWNNKLFNSRIKPIKIKNERIFSRVIEIMSKDYPEIYGDPFVDLFYFVTLDYYKCICGRLNNFKENIFFSITIKVKYDNKSINDLIKEYFFPIKTNNNKKCSCGFETETNEKYFYTSPLYLTIELDNKNQNQIIFDDEINLDSKILTDYGPTKYNFYALIIEEEIEKNKNYIVVIKNNNVYKLYSDNIVQTCGDEAKDYGNPIMVIYKGQKNLNNI